MFRKRERERVIRKAIQDLNRVKQVQCSNGNWNYSSYMHGMANGLILAEFIASGRVGTPDFLDAPTEWVQDKSCECLESVGSAL